MAPEGRKNPQLVGGVCCGCSVLITSIALIAISFQQIGVTEMALDYSSVSLTIDETKLWENGRHFIGPGHHFITYPKEQQEVRFPSDDYNTLSGRTKDGLKLDIDISFQYTLVADLQMLLNLYYTWGEEYRDAYAVIARTTLRDVAANWTAYKFFEQRTDIERQMFDRLQPKIYEVAAVLESLQLLDIRFPVLFDSMLQETEAVRLAEKRAQFDQEDAEVKATARVSRVKEEAKAIEQLKIAEAVVAKNFIDQKKEMVEAKMDAERQAFMEMGNGINGVKDRALLMYIWLEGLADKDYEGEGAGLAEGTGVVFQFDTPSIVNCYANPKSCMRGPAPYGSNAMPSDFVDFDYTCTANAQCIIKVHGFHLDVHDRLHVSNDCAGFNSPAGFTLASPIASAMSEEKAYILGNTASVGAFRVCYCSWEGKVFGCDDAESYVDVGELVIA